MSRLIKAYHSLITRHPISTQAVQTGILIGTGDLISQTIVEEKSLTHVNYKRTLQYFCVGTFFMGPALTVWYRFLHNRITTGGKYIGLKKMCIDQFCFAPFGLTGFLLSTGVVQGKSLEQIKKSFRELYLDILLANYKMWPAAQIVNFTFVPLHYQVLYVQVVALIWNVYVCHKTKPEESS